MLLSSVLFLLLYSYGSLYVTISQGINSPMLRTNELSGSVANELSGFMIHLDKQGGGHETDKIATGDFNVTF